MPGVQRSGGFHISDILDLNDQNQKVVPNLSTENDQTSLSPNGKFNNFFGFLIKISLFGTQ